jgi:hypothetical protein
MSQGLTEALAETKGLKLAQVQSGEQATSLDNKAPRKNFHLEHVPSDEMDLLITSTNEADVGFKLDTCKLQKNHEKFGEGQDCNDENDEVLLLQLGIEADFNHHTQTKSAKKHFGRADDPEFPKVLEKVQQWQKKYSTSDEIPDSEIPESYDFRSIQGYDFTNPHRD